MKEMLSLDIILLKILNSRVTIELKDLNTRTSNMDINMSDTDSNTRYTRREALKTGLVGLVSLGLGSTVVNIAESMYRNADAGEIHVPSEYDITKLMKRDDADAIFKEEYKSGNIDRIKRKPFSKKTNFQEKVYESNHPSLVLFDVTVNKDPAFKRSAIVFKNLANEFAKDKYPKINFLYHDTCEQDDFHTYREGEYYFGKEVAKEGIISAPSIGMYSKFDLVKGETPDSNDVKIAQIDIVRVGPGENSAIPMWFQDDASIQNWVIYNITKPNNNYVYRAKNTAIPIKIQY